MGRETYPNSIVTGKMTTRIISETIDMMPGMIMVAEESVSRWCDKTRCASSCERRMARSAVCDGLGTGCVGVGGVLRIPPTRLDHQGDGDGGSGAAISFSGGARARISSKKPE